MNKKDYKNPEEHIFYCDKSNWYDAVGGKKDWSKSMDKVELFWKKIRKEKMDKEDFDFSTIIFPVFLGKTFWVGGEYRRFPDKINFSNVEFSDDARFNIVEFTGSVFFSNAQFSDEADFFKVIFSGEADFSKAKFSAGASFSKAKFSRRADISNVIFSSKASFTNAKFIDATNFSKTQFSGNTNFSYAQFSDDANLSKSQFSGEADISNVIFSGEASFINARFINAAFFSKAQFSGDASFSEASFSGEAEFSNVIFSGEASFFMSQFSRKADFFNVIFSGRAEFSKAQYSGDASFSNAQFSDDANLSKSQFSGKANISNVIFSGKASFSNTKFIDAAFFSKAQFSGDASFSNAQFSADANFFEGKFSSNVDFSLTQFSGVTTFRNNKFVRVEFLQTKFASDEQLIFERWTDVKHVTFKNVQLPDKVLFLGCDMERVEFIESNIVNAEFSNCDFKRKDHRIALLNDTDNNFKDLSRVYRQLKVNQINARDWTNAGDAYRSEMVMKRRLLKQEIKAGQWYKIVNRFVMGLYDILSGYNQSMSRPLAWLAGLWIVVPITLYISVHPALPIDYDQVYNAFKTSFDAALPIAGKIDVGDYHKSVYFLLLFERVFTLVLLTFFGLATRARLRQ